MNVLIIEDDPTLAHNIRDALTAEHFLVENVYDGSIAERLLRKNTFHCVVMDVNLPGTNGFDLCCNFRKFNDKTPVLFLTAFAELDDKIQGFNSGADDYLTKPFYMRELILRIQALIKRSESKHPSNIIVADDITINLQQKIIQRQTQNINLTPREFHILVRLCQHPGEIVSKQELLQQIWGTNSETTTNVVEVFVNLLRNKIDRPFNKNSIKTKIGYGYYFDTNQ